IIGRKVTALYDNLTDDNSTLMKAVRQGETVFNLKQELTTKKGRKIVQIGSTFPIIADNQVIGAIEFAKYLYDNDSVRYVKNHSEHKIFRKNNTIYTIDDIITRNEKMLEIKETIRRVANTDSSVLIYGKTGTGKELVAQAVHNLSSCSGKPFISMNCAAIPHTLFESTLFGTVKGSYTGAVDSKGLFEIAQGGTIFMDEINSMDMSMQVKVLKAVEEKRIRRVGGNQNIDLNVRFIAALNEDPYKLIEEGKLREDLFYRLGVIQIDLPSLAQRKDDISCLTDYYIQYYNRRMNKAIKGISDEVLQFFSSYEWPGNVRELRHCIEAIFIINTEGSIKYCDIPAYMKKRFLAHSAAGNTGSGDLSLKDIIERYEKKIIALELKNAKGCAADAARKLGMSRQALKYKTDKYKLL
ncbi:MAG: sigma-54 interaction domain-containing protein, partial [Pseudomonadota bacterium]